MTAPPPHIGILVYPNAQMAAVHGLTDLFAVADRLQRQRTGNERASLRISQLVSPADTMGPAPVFDTHEGEDGEPDVLILPPSLGAPPIEEIARPFTTWLRAQHGRGTALASVCAGAFLLAESGVLSGRAATTHWAYARMFKERYPDVHVDADKLLIDDGDILTAGGVMAWTDLGLRLVQRLLGPTAMIETARFLLVDPPGREQRYYSAFSPRLNHGDGPILKVQHWLQANGARAIQVGAMADVAGLEERTFLRRFRAATGLRPIEYCQQVRIARARDMLETTTTAIDQVGWRVGYDDPASFRRLFVKLTGLTPGDYRRRFGTRQTSATGRSTGIDVRRSS